MTKCTPAPTGSCRSLLIGWMSFVLFISPHAGAFSFSRGLRAREQWKNQAYMKASNGDADDSFGSSLAIDGDTLVVGSYLEDSPQNTITNGTGSSALNTAANSGAVFVYRRVGNDWVQEAYIKAPNAGAGDFFGYRVDISGDTLAVSAYKEDSSQAFPSASAASDDTATDAGAVYIFKRTGVTWAFEAYLKAANAEANDFFGWGVAISGNTVVVGATQEASSQTSITNGTTASADNAAADAGAAYVFKRSGTTWSQEAYLKASNAGASDFYGTRVDIDSDTIVVSSHREDSNQVGITNGTGVSTDNSSVDSGAAFVYRRTGSTWAQEAYIKSNNSEAGDFFSYNSVSIDGDTLAIGAQSEDSNFVGVINGTGTSAVNGASASGAMYIYRRTGAVWNQEAYIKAPNSEAGDAFGFACAVSGDSLVVGSYKEDSAQTTNSSDVGGSADNSVSNAGAAYVYRRLGTKWVQRAYLKASNPDIDDFFGYAVGISAQTISVGAYNEDSNQITITNGLTASSDNSKTDSGAAYLFKR